MDAGELARLLASLEAGELRARRAAEALDQLSPDEAVELLGELIRRADRRTDPEAAALEGLLHAVRELLDEERLDLLYRAAEAAADLEVQALLARTEPARSFDHEKEEWIDREMRGRTLGERRSLARTRDRDLLSRLASDQDPTVVRHVLQNPRCTEREALLAASRRPQRPEVLEEIFHSRRWSLNRRVRRAIALNPYRPPALASAALALLTAPDLREIARDLTVSTELRVHARRLLGNRRGEAG
jgi:Mg/Co/Ni transporter MgtE